MLVLLFPSITLYAILQVAKQAQACQLTIATCLDIPGVPGAPSVHGVHPMDPESRFLLTSISASGCRDQSVSLTLHCTALKCNESHCTAL